MPGSSSPKSNTLLRLLNSGQNSLKTFLNTRKLTELLCEPLEPDDYLLQSMPDCSPPKWHLAHTTWFFEQFLLSKYLPDYQPHHPDFCFLFNSYYEAVGKRWPRPARGLLSRPTLNEVWQYRQAVDDQMSQLLVKRHPSSVEAEIARLVEIGVNHEQQHQELLLTDLKHALGLNPLRPAYRPTDDNTPTVSEPAALTWHCQPAGLSWVGFRGEGFSFDNESPRHRVFLEGFELASRPVTAGEYLGFMEDGGYSRPEFWLSDGWAACQTHNWESPLHWHRNDNGWELFTLHGNKPLDPSEPVCHISFYEADAYARWAGVRLPTEAEWEAVAATLPLQGHFLNPSRLHPTADNSLSGQFFGTVWEWTASPYTAYPGYKPDAGALGEYNGKFMCNQMVLRGGSCVTPAGHVRPTYRNFFPADARWQFSGLRLARTIR